MSFKKGFVIVLLSLVLIFSFSSMAMAYTFGPFTNLIDIVDFVKTKYTSYSDCTYYLITSNTDGTNDIYLFSSPITINSSNDNLSSSSHGFSTTDIKFENGAYYTYGGFYSQNNSLSLNPLYSKIIASNHDIKITGSDTVFFERPPVPYPILAGEVLGEEMSKTLKILVPVGLAILSALLGIYFIPRLIRLFL